VIHNILYMIKGYFDSGCFRHMTENKSFLTDYQEIDGGFGGSPKGGRKPALSFMRPFGCLVTILNTLDHLGTGPNWMFDIDSLTMSMNYQPVFAGTQTNDNTGTKANIDEGQGGMKTVPGPQYVLLPFFTFDSQSPKSSEDEVADDARKKNGVLDPVKEDDKSGQEEATNTNNKDANGNSIYRMFTPVNAARSSCDNLGGSIPVNASTLPNADLPTDPLMPDLEDTGIFSSAYDDKDVGAEADLNNLETTMNVSPIPITRIHKDHPKNQIIRDINSATQTRRMKVLKTCFEEVYVCQSPGFEDPQFPDKVYKVEKALYGLHQAPRAWYETLSTYLLENRFRRGIIDKTLFIKKDKGDILLVQVYVDDIIFVCVEFEQMMHKRFQMSSMGELTFFLGLQVKKKDDGIFVSQEKYMDNILKKFDFVTVKIASTPIETNKALLKDEEAEDVDVDLYRSMIGSLMYLIAYRPDIMKHTPLFQGMVTIQAEEGKGLGHLSEPQPPPSTAQPIHEEPIPNVVSSSHQKTQTLGKPLKPGGSPRCEEATGGSITQTRVLALETDLRQIKKVYGAAYTKLIMKGRMMTEEIDQDAGVTLVTPTHSQEDQHEDQLGVFSAAKVLADEAKNVYTYTRRRRAVSTGSGRVSTASRLFSTAEESVSTAGASMPVSTAGMQRQERASYEATVRLQEQLDEEERQRITKMHEEASSFNIEERENIQATIKADEELAQRIQADEREKYAEAKKARLLAELINQRKRYFTQQIAEERRKKPLTQAQ
ncbi:uncharacterized mitochondrial protein-like protein, partial [Tanacetum coccineum]